jgi:carboxymethylenebutenolidase
MGEKFEVRADGHRFSVYGAAPLISPRAAIVVIQEIFGVNAHIRAVADGFAAEGYLAIAPALFDRLRPKIELGYSDAEIAEGRGLRARLDWKDCLADVQAAITYAGKIGPVGIVGYCFGGGVAWLAASRLEGLKAAVGYYGGPWVEFAREAPRCPVMLHFAAKDANIPVKLAEEMRANTPTLIAHVYDADHGFNCDQRPQYDAFAAALARRRTLAFFKAVLG